MTCSDCELTKKKKKKKIGIVAGFCLCLFTSAFMPEDGELN